MPPLQRQADFLSDSEHSQITATPEEPLIKTVDVDEIDQALHSNKKSVSFGSIQIREYNRVVGDHPDVQVGPPISIGWDFVEHESKSLDTYEADRPPRKFLRRLSSITRKNMLANVFGVPEEEIRAAEKEVQAIIKSRERTNKASKRGSALKSATKKMKRVMLGESLMKGLAAAAGAMMPVHTQGTSMGGLTVY
ncbi:expressed unknown protein [Seminavis robusta]|uniref:Uncharacterized protein n=1 Tax=Seminavis robusta TaxID=568900 RepID=A0A9N8EEC8_9STRA|nr:expressed unknown protein [Seminavis robusta]|eukprot:Sro815_g206550.1 n/a (194) ;mRNA; r:36304-36885